MSTNTSPTAKLLEKSRRRPTSPRIFAALALGGALAVGGLAFAGGRLTAPAAAAFPGGGGGPGPGGFQGPGGQGPGGGGFGGGGLGLTGTITSLDADVLTLQTADGSTITVNLSGDTTYAREDTATSDELAEGTDVRIGIDFGDGGNVGSNEVDASSVTITEPQ
jgi:hypothetical protein